MTRLLAIEDFAPIADLKEGAFAASRTLIVRTILGGNFDMRKGWCSLRPDGELPIGSAREAAAEEMQATAGARH